MRIMHENFGYTPEQVRALAPHEIAERLFWVELLRADDIARRLTRSGGKDLTDDEHQYIADAINYLAAHEDEFKPRPD